MKKFVLQLQENTQLEDAIKLLDQNGNGVLPVVDAENKFIGIITDGDIRKAILNKSFDLDHIVNKSPYVLETDTTTIQRIQYLKKIKRRQIPIIDEENRFVEIFTLDDVDFNLKTNWVVIMAGGLGTRLGELTKDTPKPMLEIGQKPILEHIIESFTSFGFTKFVLSVNYKSEIIERYFGDGNRWGIEIKYLHEYKRLGTGGSLSLIDLDLKDPFFLINGDVLTTLNYEQLLKYHENSESFATMCVCEHDFQIPYGVIEIGSDNCIKTIVEKPVYQFLVNAGVYLFNPEVIKYIPVDEYFDLPDLFKLLNNDKKTTKTYIIQDFWADVGKKEDYVRVSERMQLRNGIEK